MKIKFNPETTIETESGVEVSVGTRWRPKIIKGLTPDGGAVTVSGLLLLSDSVAVTLTEPAIIRCFEINTFVKHFEKTPF